MAKAKETEKTAELTPDMIRTAYRHMLLARLLDDRMWVLNRAGRAPFVIPGRGHEAAQVAWAMALRPTTDFFLPYYRDLGVLVSLGYSARQTLLALLGKAEELTSGGRQMPGHYGWRERHVITGSSPVTTQVLHAVGIAYAMQMRGEDGVAATALGEGSTSQGDFHEAMNWASIFRLPVLFIVENNFYAISEPLKRQMAVPEVADRALGYGMRGLSADGNDFFASYEVVHEAAEKARRGEGPSLVELKTYRLTPHSSDDDDRSYRTREEVESWKARDPIARMRDEVLRRGVLSPSEDEALHRELLAEVDEATQYAEKAQNPRVEDMSLHLYND